MNLDPLSLLVGGLLTSGSYMIGFLRGRRAKRSPKPSQPVCGCDHELSYHDPKTNSCHHERYSTAASRLVKCTCRQYTGPAPLPEYYAPELG